MKLKSALTIVLAFFCISAIFCQTNGKYHSIEEALKNPSNVVELQLSGIKEKLPKDIKKFDNLETVKLINLPKEYDLNDAFQKLGKYTSVKKIYLYGNPQNELPSSLSGIKTLEFIELNKNLANNLKTIIDQLIKLEHFKSLSLRSMGLSKLPDNITQIKIVELNLDNNPRLNLVKEFDLLATLKLEILNISASTFKVVPENIKNLKNLKRVVIERNKENFNNAESYKNLSQLKNLTELNIQGNFFGSLDPEVEKLNFLKLIEIDGNCIVDERLENLKKLLPDTKIQNEIPC